MDGGPQNDLLSSFGMHEPLPGIQPQIAQSTAGPLGSSLYSGQIEEIPLGSSTTVSPLQYEDRPQSLTNHLQSANVQFPPPSHVANFASMPSAFEQELWNPNILSTINWLGIDAGSIDVGMHFAALQSSPYQLPERTHEERPFQQSSIPISAPCSVSGQNDERRSINEYQEIRSDSHSMDSAVTVESSPRGANADIVQFATGEFYVDGQPARLPRVSYASSILQCPKSSCANPFLQLLCRPNADSIHGAG